MRPDRSLPLSGSSADGRLDELDLTRKSLLAVADSALAARRDVSPFALRMAPGMNMFLIGGESLRGEHVGDRWLVHVAGNLEGIIHATGRTIVYFSSAVDCCKQVLPQPRTRKGPQNELAAAANLFEAKGIDLPRLSRGEGTICAAVYYLLVDEDGRAELSSMVIEDGAFVGYGERIFLRGDADLEPELERLGGEPSPEIEIAISRK